MTNGQSMSSRKVPAAPQRQWFERNWRTSLIAILLLALTLRFGAAAWVEHRVQDAGTRFLIEGDANGYWYLGNAIAHGDDYAIYQPPRRIMRVPGFSLLLAGIIRIFGSNIWAARVILAIIGTGCCGFTFLLGSQLMNRRIGLLAASIVAVHPFHVAMSVLILSETWFTFWMLASLLALSSLIGAAAAPQSLQMPSDDSLQPQSRRSSLSLVMRAALTGILIACTVLVRPGFIPWLGLVLPAVVWFSTTRPLARGVIAATIVGAFGVTMLPWVIRNHNVTDHWVLTSLWSGPSLYDGLNFEADGTSNMTFFDQENVMARMSEFEMNAHYQKRAVDFALANPGRTIKLALRKAARFLQPAPSTPPLTWSVWVVCGLFYLIFTGLCMAGTATRHTDIRNLLICWGPFLLFLTVHMVFVGSLRYRLPTEFPLAIVAAAGLQSWPLQRRNMDTPGAGSSGRRNGH